MRGGRDQASLTLVHQAMEIFQLLPTSPMHRWLIAADWLEEAGAEVAAAAFRERMGPDDNPNDPKNLYCKTDGYGDGTGHGEGYGDGEADGYGKGEGYRDSMTGSMGDHGYGDGRGSGNCCGEEGHIKSHYSHLGNCWISYLSFVIRHWLRQRRRMF